jgi:hypothetical protein
LTVWMVPNRVMLQFSTDIGVCCCFHQYYEIPLDRFTWHRPPPVSKFKRSMPNGLGRFKCNTNVGWCVWNSSEIRALWVLFWENISSYVPCTVCVADIWKLFCKLYLFSHSCRYRNKPAINNNNVVECNSFYHKFIENHNNFRSHEA